MSNSIYVFMEPDFSDKIDKIVLRNYENATRSYFGYST